MNSDEDKIYMKIVAFNEIYNFVVQIFLFEVIFGLKKSIYYPDLDSISNFLVQRWLQMKKV
jgi:hypothetical protein